MSGEGDGDIAPPHVRGALRSSEIGISEGSPHHHIGKFIPIKTYVSMGEELYGRSEKLRRFTRRVISLRSFDAFLGTVILVDIVLQCYVADLGAAERDVPFGVTLAGYLFYCMYCLELSASLFVNGLHAFTDKWVILDACIVGGGALDLIIELSGQSAKMSRPIRMLKIFRMLRLMRIFRKLSFLKGIRKFLQMMTSCLRTLGWALVFGFLLMTFWSMAVVEFIHPLMKDMPGAWDDCPECLEATSTVMRTNFLLFKTVVVGDEFGSIADPVINMHPWAVLIFVGAQVTIVFCLLNIIVAVVVDEFAEQRQKDVMTLAHDLEEELSKDAKHLQAVFKATDLDGSGEICLEELVESAKQVPELASRLRVMDIDDEDLGQLFQMLDEDNSGEISQEEFTGVLGRWLQDSKTASRFTKYNILRALEGQDRLRTMMEDKYDVLIQKLGVIEWDVSKLQHDRPLPTKQGGTYHPRASNAESSDSQISYFSERQALAESLAEASSKVELALANSLELVKAATEGPAVSTVIAAAIRAQQEAVTMTSALQMLLPVETTLAPPSCLESMHNGKVMGSDEKKGSLSEEEGLPDTFFAMV